MPQPVAIDLPQSLPLSERDRAVFFEALVHPPEPNARLRRAFLSARERVIRLRRLCATAGLPPGDFCRG
jgi:hypothetical protein